MNSSGIFQGYAIFSWKLRKCYEVTHARAYGKCSSDVNLTWNFPGSIFIENPEIVHGFDPTGDSGCYMT